MHEIKFIFAKNGLMKYISHLDLMRLFMRALRRAEIPVKITQGFNPHPKISLKRALKLGVESENEEAAFFLNEPVDPVEFRDRLQKQFPQGIQIKSVWLVETKNV